MPECSHQSHVGPLADSSYAELIDDDESDVDPAPPPPPPRGSTHSASRRAYVPCKLSRRGRRNPAGQHVSMSIGFENVCDLEAPLRPPHPRVSASLTERNLAAHMMASACGVTGKESIGHRRTRSGEQSLLKGSRLMRLLKGSDDSLSVASGASGGAKSTSSFLGSISSMGKRLGSLARSRGFGLPDQYERAKDLWRDLAPHADILKQSVKNTMGSRIHAMAGL